MGCICKCHKCCKEKYMKKEIDENDIFNNMKKQINKSMGNISETINDIKSWDELFHPNEENWFDDENFKMNKIDIDTPKYNNISYFKFLFSYNCEKIIESRCCFTFFLYADYFFVRFN